jgi:hypothetical protein
VSPWRADLPALLLLLLLGAAAAILAYRVPAASRLDVGTLYAAPYLRGFTNPEQNAIYTYAFSTDRSELRLPGVGAGAHLLSMRLSEWRPDVTEPTQVTLHDGQRLLGTFTLSPQAPMIYHLLVPSENGDLTLRWSGTVSVPGGDDSRRLGVAVDWVETQPLQPYAAPLQVLNLLAIALLAYILLRRLALRPPGALALAAAPALALAVLLATERIWWTIYTPRLSALLLGLNLSLWPLQALARWAWRRGGVALTPANEIWLWRILMLAALVKIGGVIHPQIIVFDERWHVPRTQLVLDGRLMELIVPSRVTLLGETVGLDGGHFPYSPLWYLVTAPFGWLGADLGIASNVLNAALDVSRSLLIIYIAMRMFGSQRAALAAGGIYHLLPMPYFLLSWGNWPTQLGLWGALLLIAVVVATFERPGERATLALLVAAALIAMLTYTVVGIVSFTMIGTLAMLEWLRRSNQLGRLRTRTLLGALVAAEVVAFLLYHIWYVPTILADTLPALARAITGHQRELHGTPEAGLIDDLVVNWNYARNHLTWAVIPLVPLGAILAWRRASRARLLLVAWALVLVIFSLFSWAVADMIFKHIFFVLPLIAICAGLVHAALWSRRGRATRLVPIVMLLYLAAVCAERWYDYIMIKRH